jgi:hypothetical protein
MQLMWVRLTTQDTPNTHEADTLGRNWYNSLLTAGRNSSCLKLTTRDATDTREANTLGRNSYNISPTSPFFEGVGFWVVQTFFNCTGFV